MAKMCATFVRSCSSTGTKPRSSTSTPAASSPSRLPFGRAADGDEHAVERLRRRGAVALERHLDAASSVALTSVTFVSRWIAA